MEQRQCVSDKKHIFIAFNLLFVPIRNGDKHDKKNDYDSKDIGCTLRT